MITNRDLAQVALFSTLLIIIPLVVFPARFGLDLNMGMFTYAIFEILFYGVVFFILRSESTFIEITQAIGLTFLYRFFLGTIFGILLWAVYKTNFSVSLALGISRYLPVVFMQILAAPFVMKPLFINMFEEPPIMQRRPVKSTSTGFVAKEEKVVSFRQGNRSSQFKSKPVRNPMTTSQKEENDTGINLNMNGFERAVRYLGEHHAVHLAAVVDCEGLPLAVFKRGDIDPDRWTPMARVFQDSNEQQLNRRGETNGIDEFSICFGAHRLAMVKINNFNLLVLSQQDEDDLLKIRLTQASDVVRKYSSERYSGLLMAGAEEQKYVSST
jgi:predicted regulator of Ras-like GTPase activity (Roadblock/LC7/MglB family)